jgi:hypothetical protein
LWTNRRNETGATGQAVAIPPPKREELISEA